jgi:hypothetical protein
MIILDKRLTQWEIDKLLEELLSDEDLYTQQ